MLTRSRWLGWVWPCICMASLAAGAAWSDDWPQFRHDGERTAASTDPTRLPFTEIWTIPRVAPMLGEKGTWTKFAVWNGSIYYFELPLGSKLRPVRTLACADARTGAPRWVLSLLGTKLRALETHGQVAVSNSGLVFIYNDLTNEQAAAAGLRNAYVWSLDNLAVEAYNAHSGAFVTRYLTRAMFADPKLPHDSITRLYLPDGRGTAAADLQPEDLEYRVINAKTLSPPILVYDSDYVTPPDTLDLRRYVETNVTTLPAEASGGWRGFLFESLPSSSGAFMRDSMRTNLLMGPMLLRDNEVTATGVWDQLFRWNLGPFSQNMRVIHPRPEHTDPDYTPLTSFGGFPATSLGSATVVGSDVGNRFLAVIDPSASRQRYVWWHRDWQGSLGIATVSNHTIFLGTGGANADESIAALDTSTGVNRWSYAPTSIRGETPIGEQFIAWRSWRMVPGPDMFGQDGKLKHVFYRQDINSGRQSVPTWPTARAHLTNPGLVAVGDRIYGAAAGRVAALDQRSGEVKWVWPIPTRLRATSLVASKDHLFVSLAGPVKPGANGAVCALRLTDGKELWNAPLPNGAEAGLANGLLFLSDTEYLHTFAPAERTFRLAVDSDRPEEYLPPALAAPPSEDGAADTGPPPPPLGGNEGAAAAIPQPAPPGRADATVLRLKWGRPAAELLEQVRRRREALPSQPLLLSLDWLDAQRSTPLGAVLTANGTAEFAELCGHLAALSRPAWFDVAPEVNVYLARNPAQQEAVLSLIRAAREAVHAGYGPAKVTASCNLEVLTNRYTSADYQPFGRVPRVPKQAAELLPALGEVIDAVGVSSYPQCAYARPEQMPADHFLAPKEALLQALTAKPFLVTSIAVWRNPKLGEAEARQAGFVRRALRACYWLDAPLVAYPEALAPLKPMGASVLPGKGGETEREWREVLAWKRVMKLSSQVPAFGPQAGPAGQLEAGDAAPPAAP